ncbi:MAG TPA: MotA/TolQ/ExbB proton channel family protein [Candidatus Polarisedimenticolaceae bacterium]
MTAPILATNATNLDVWSLVLQSGPMATFILVVLAGFSVVSWAILAERFKAFRRAESETDAFLQRFQQGGGLAAIQDATAPLKHSPVAAVFRAGFREISLNPPPSGHVTETAELEALDRVLRKTATVKLHDLERSLGLLATTAGATPFIGLFGTVWGIMNAFRAIGGSQSASLQSYAPGIAEALVATAAGLAAAIPALIGYNHFQRRLRSIETRLEEFTADFIHRVQGRRS